ncbi:hypothetical protein BA6E_102186 [Bacteroidales bacterium 6E]|nr:hypothetical protein BA6E_102186 [Bacteroidales bacterium 6E]
MKRQGFSKKYDHEGTSDPNDQLLDDILKSDFQVTLPSDFAARVARRYTRHQTASQYVREFLTYAAGIILGLLAGGAVVYFFSNDLEQWLTFWNAYGTKFIYLGVFVFFILFFDKLVLPLLYLKKSGKVG